VPVDFVITSQISFFFFVDMFANYQLHCHRLAMLIRWY